METPCAHAGGCFRIRATYTVRETYTALAESDLLSKILPRASLTLKSMTRGKRYIVETDEARDKKTKMRQVIVVMTRRLATP